MGKGRYNCVLVFGSGAMVCCCKKKLFRILFKISFFSFAASFKPYSFFLQVSRINDTENYSYTYLNQLSLLQICPKYTNGRENLKKKLSGVVLPPFQVKILVWFGRGPVPRGPFCLLLGCLLSALRFLFAFL